MIKSESRIQNSEVSFDMQIDKTLYVTEKPFQFRMFSKQIISSFIQEE